MAFWLPPRSAVSFSLCNHKLYLMLSHRTLPLLDQNDSYNNERAIFLQTLDRDLPGTLYCFFWKRLHVLLQRHEIGLRAEQIHKRVWQGRCRWDRNYDGAFNTYHIIFKFDRIPMAMTLYRRGLVSDAKAYLKVLALLQPTIWLMTLLPRNIGCYFFEPRFLKNQISIRAQSWIVIAEEQGSVLSRIHLRQVCPHRQRVSSTHDNIYFMSLACNRKHLVAKEDSCEKCRGLIRCRYCPTEVSIEQKRLNKDSRDGVLIITKWQKLGQGLSPSEAHWRKHLECPTCPCTPWPYHPDDTLRSIRAGYEDQPGTKYDAILKMAKTWKLLEETKGKVVKIYFDPRRRLRPTIDTLSTHQLSDMANQRMSGHRLQCHR